MVMSVKHTAIIIDDDPDVSSLLEDLLDMNDFDILGVATDGLDGFNLFKQHNPDVVLLDYHMPKYDGIYTLQLIRELSPNAIVMMLSADETLRFNPRLMSLKPNKVLIKPFKITTFSDELKETMLGLQTSTIE